MTVRKNKWREYDEDRRRNAYWNRRLEEVHSLELDIEDLQALIDEILGERSHDEFWHNRLHHIDNMHGWFKPRGNRLVVDADISPYWREQLGCDAHPCRQKRDHDFGQRWIPRSGYGVEEVEPGVFRRVRNRYDDREGVDRSGR